MSVRSIAIIIIMFVVIILISAFFFVSLSFTHQSLNTAIENDLSFAIEVVNGLISTKMQLLKSNASHFAERLLRAVSKEEMTELMKEHITACPECQSHTILDRNGKIIAYYDTPISKKDRITHSKEIERVFNEGVTIITSPFYCYDTGSFIMCTLTPLGPDRILVLTQDGLIFTDLVSGYKLWETGKIYLVNGEGTIIADVNKKNVYNKLNVAAKINENMDLLNEEDKGIGDFLQYVLQYDKDIFSYYNNGIEYLCSYKKLTGTLADWHIIVEAPLNESQKMHVQKGLFNAALSLLIFGIILSVFLSNFIAKPYKKLEKLNAEFKFQNRRIKILLDAMPLSCCLWNKNFQIFECNEASLRLFNIDNKHEFIDRYFELYTEKQPDGIPSKEKITALLKKAMSGETIFDEWTYQLPDGTLLPTELTLIRVPYDGEFAIAGYVRDMSIYNKMMQDIQATAAKFEAVISNYSGIIWNVDRNNIITLLNGLHIKNFGLSPLSYEGWFLDSAQNDNEKLKTIISKIQETIDEGSQDWICEIDGKKFHAHTTPVIENGDVVSVIGIIDDITKISQLKAELEAALDTAQKASNAKSNFLASMSHEMRTPLNAIIGLTGLLLEGNKLNAEARLNIEKTYNAGITLLNIVNDVLDISKIEAGKMELVSVDYDVPSLINDTITLNLLRIGAKPVTFILNIEPDMFAQLHGDDIRIKQIISNLLSNAIKYTHKGTVQLSMYCIRENSKVWLTIRVEDTGSGIRTEDIDKLFSDYSQLDLEANRIIEGTGLGLPITKRLSQMMSGYVSIESEFGKGSVFTVKIMQDFVSDTRIGREVAQSLKNFSYYDNKHERNMQIERIWLPDVHVLIVDDNLTNLDIAKGLLKLYGMQIDCVTRGKEAIDAIRIEKIKYNAIFMDHMMPGMNGIEAARLIREIGSEYAKNIPIIALTANAITGNEQMFLNAGFQAFLSKPMDISSLDEIIRRWLWDKTKKTEPENKNTISENTVIKTKLLNGKMIEGLDIKKGMERFGGNETMYLDALRSYQVNTRSLLGKIEDVSEGNLSEYAVTVHGIKSSTRGIGASPAGDIAAALENAAAAGDYDFVSINNINLLVTLGKLINDIETLLSVTDAEKQKPKRNYPDRTLLLQLIEHCDNFNIDGAFEVIAEIDKYQYASDSDLVEWLKENISKGYLENIREKLLNFWKQQV